MEFFSLIAPWKRMESKERFNNFGVQILKNILKMIYVVACYENVAVVEVIKVIQQ